jgi:GNAT superfamily N-acetyltransferase
MSTMHLRVMTAADIERVAVLCGQLGYPSTTREVGDRFEILQRRADEGIFVAVDDAPAREAAGGGAANDGGVVGWVHVRPMLTLESNPAAEIAGLVVDDGWHGRGVGRALVEAAETWAAEHGYAEMRVRSNVVRERAHEFYRRLGYEVIKTQANFRKAVQRRKPHA